MGSFLRRPLQLLRTLLGDNAVQTRFDDIEEADDQWIDLSSRQTIILPGKMIKRQAPELTRIELEKTTQGCKIGRETGLFSTPKILEHDVDRGQIAIEWIDDVVPLWRAFRVTDNPLRLAAKLGEALAAIHNRLSLPDDMRNALPGDLMTDAMGPVVCLHGDFNVFNVLVRPEDDELFIIDWLASGRLAPNADGGYATIGPCHFDLVWLVSTLFLHKYWRWQRIDQIPEKAELFLEGYFQNIEHQATPDQFWQYLRHSHATLLELLGPRHASLSAKLLHARRYSMDRPSLTEYVRRPSR